LASAVIESLRAEIARVESGERRSHAVLPFDAAEIDARLPGGGLALDEVHEVGRGRDRSGDDAAATLFVAGIAARIPGSVLWCRTRGDLFAPSLALVGLSPDRVIHMEGGDDQTILAGMEEGLRHGGLGAVVGEVARPTMTASRRLRLAAESGGTPALILRRGPVVASDPPTSATTRWRISVLPSAPRPAPGLGRGRWLVELARCRGGEGATFEVEACDAAGRLHPYADVADGSGATGFEGGDPLRYALGARRA